MWLCAQREPLYAFCGLEVRGRVSGKNLVKTGTMAKMVTQHGKVECSDAKSGTLSRLCTFRGIHDGLYLGAEAR